MSFRGPFQPRPFWDPVIFAREICFLRHSAICFCAQLSTESVNYIGCLRLKTFKCSAQAAYVILNPERCLAVPGAFTAPETSASHSKQLESLRVLLKAGWMLLKPERQDT